MVLFGSWEYERLLSLGSTLAEVVHLAGDGFEGLPSADDAAFWSDITAQCNKHQEVERVRSNELCACTHIELDSLDISLIHGGALGYQGVRDQPLYLSNVPSGVSHLAHAVLGTTQLILVGGISALRSWNGRPRPAGSTLWIDAAEPLVPQLEDASRFASQGPTMIASPDGRGVGAVVAAAICAHREGLSSQAALHEVEKRRGGSLRIEMDDEEELAIFCQSMLLIGVPSDMEAAPSLATTPKGNASPTDACSPVKKRVRFRESGAAVVVGKARRLRSPQLDGWKL